MNLKNLKLLIKKALEEDVGKQDITTSVLIPQNLIAQGSIIAKEKGVICGLEVAKLTFHCLNKKIKFTSLVKEGELVKKGKKIAFIQGKAQDILKAERVALNFLQHLSGIATQTRKIVNLVKEYPVKILDTRKTTPLLRKLQKYAVRIGGGFNHRFGLYDGILIKDNHLKLIKDIKFAVSKFKNKEVEVEVKNLKEVKEALESKAKIIMLDNMKIKDIEKAVKLIKKKVRIEVSGGITEKNIKEIAKTGIDFISIGALTHSVKALDISLELKPLFSAEDRK